MASVPMGHGALPTSEDGAVQRPNETPQPSQNRTTGLRACRFMRTQSCSRLPATCAGTCLDDTLPPRAMQHLKVFHKC